MRKINFTMKEISGAKEVLWDVVEHVGHVLVDASIVRLAVDLVAVLDEASGGSWPCCPSLGACGKSHCGDDR